MTQDELRGVELFLEAFKKDPDVYMGMGLIKVIEDLLEHIKKLTLDIDYRTPIKIR